MNSEHGLIKPILREAFYRMPDRMRSDEDADRFDNRDLPSLSRCELGEELFRVFMRLVIEEEGTNKDYLRVRAQALKEALRHA